MAGCGRRTEGRIEIIMILVKSHPLLTEDLTRSCTLVTTFEITQNRVGFGEGWTSMNNVHEPTRQATEAITEDAVPRGGSLRWMAGVRQRAAFPTVPSRRSSASGSTLTKQMRTARTCVRIEGVCDT